MRSNIVLYISLAAFFILADASYVAWSLIDQGQVEWVGMIAMLFAALLVGWWGFFLHIAHRRQGGLDESDRDDAEIDDGDPEIGDFHPSSWWPLLLSAALGLQMIGVAIGGSWLVFIAGPFVLLCVVGWVMETYRGNFAR